MRDGFEPMDELHRVKAPWYQVPPLDFFSELLWPGEIRDERIVDFEMKPKRILPREDLVNRADDFRGSVQQGYVVPNTDGGGF